MLRLGLLSTARINRQTLTAAAESDRVEVVAVASRGAERAVAYAREHGIPRSHASYEALLEDEGVDAVYVSLPNALHHAWTLRALAAGKHVLSEKPYSRRPAEVEEAFALAEQYRLVLTEAFMYRHHPQTELVRSLVAQGKIGRLRFVRSMFSFRLDDGGDVRLSRDLAGGALMDVGCYCVSGTRLLAGEPVRVSGEAVRGDSGVDVGFAGTLRFADDVVAQFEASFRLPRRQLLVAAGEEATLVVRAPWRVDWGGGLELRRDGQVEVLDVPAASSYRLQLDDLAAAVAGERAPLVGREDVLGQARAIDALYRAADSAVSVAL